LNSDASYAIGQRIPHFRRASDANFTRTTWAPGANFNGYRFAAPNLNRYFLTHEMFLGWPRRARRAEARDTKTRCELPSHVHNSEARIPPHCSWRSCRWDPLACIEAAGKEIAANFKK